jgi:hypothetical protein
MMMVSVAMVMVMAVVVMAEVKVGHEHHAADLMEVTVVRNPLADHFFMEVEDVGLCGGRRGENERQGGSGRQQRLLEHGVLRLWFMGLANAVSPCPRP